MSSVITRFAPSPTGDLHLGSARTALYNWLYSKANIGKFLLRIEDTDSNRSQQELITSIKDNLKWLGINWDHDVILQSERKQRHTEIAHQLLESGHAYRCYLSAEEIEHRKKLDPYARINSPWRDSARPEPKNKPYVIRLRIEERKKSTFTDQVHGTTTLNNAELEDLVILRSDSTPTYILAVVVDDHDMQISDIIRGNDHIMSTFYQIQIYNALNWQKPNFTHIPLIHDEAGSKLSKRKGALGIGTYRELGYLPEAMCNYLLRLGWGKADIEIISMDEVSKIFSLSDIGRSPARIDSKKLDFFNAYYMRNKPDNELLEYLTIAHKITHEKLKTKLKLAIKDIKERASNMLELKKIAGFYIQKSTIPDAKSQLILDALDTILVQQLCASLDSINVWDEVNIERKCKEFASLHSLKINKVMPMLRALIVALI